MSKDSTPSNQKTIVLMVEVLPADARGNRKIIVSGAPKDEMPVVRGGLFANRHALLDDVYRGVMKRAPQIITHPKQKAGKPAPDADDATEQGDEPIADYNTPPSESDTTAEETSAARDQLVAADAPAPIIENDPTQEAAHG